MRVSRLIMFETGVNHVPLAFKCSDEGSEIGNRKKEVWFLEEKEWR